MHRFPLDTHVIVLDAQHAARPIAIGPSLYADLDRDHAGFQGCILIAQHTFDQDWPTWECHPAGDEILYLVSGKIEMRIRHDAAELRVLLDTPGQSAIVPKGCWHTGHVVERATVLFVTPGAGTENAAQPR